MKDFVCRICHNVRDWYSQMHVIGATPEDCDGIIAGMPYKNTGICTVCTGEEEYEIKM